MLRLPYLYTYPHTVNLCDSFTGKPLTHSAIVEREGLSCIHPRTPTPHTTGTTHTGTTIPTGGTKVLPLSIHGSIDMTSTPPPRTVYGRRNTHRVPHIASIGFLLPPLYQ